MTQREQSGAVNRSQEAIPVWKTQSRGSPRGPNELSIARGDSSMRGVGSETRRRTITADRKRRFQRNDEHDAEAERTQEVKRRTRRGMNGKMNRKHPMRASRQLQRGASWWRWCGLREWWRGSPYVTRPSASSIAAAAVPSPASEAVVSRTDPPEFALALLASVGAADLSLGASVWIASPGGSGCPAAGTKRGSREGGACRSPGGSPAAGGTVAALARAGGWARVAIASVAARWYASVGRGIVGG